ncbi:glycosyltransferase family 1 protein [Actinophytocola sp.]|uniref:glycosyltransferase family 4 protein n=1 Tax=Actinophytocola sp. TaxID=1872138 RepID=UPI002D4EF788|nr:glycosyltransferase family 1 protein [Actinophytocola sp.]HYQ65529.1 glycosyltransferase family 1 protein [Actinophytocola sp.]
MPELVVLTEQLLAPVPGGTGRYTRELLPAMAAAAPPGWTVAGVTATHRDLQPAVVADVAGPRALPLPRRGLTALWEHGVHFWPGGDAVHAPTPFAPPAPKRGRCLVVTVHDTVPFTHPETLTRRGAAWHQTAIRRATARANAVVVPTVAVAEELQKYAPGPAPIAVVPHGVPDLFRQPMDPNEAALRTGRLRLPETYVLAVGTVEPRKGLDVLVRAMARRHAPDLPLVVAGPRGWGGVDLVELAAEHGFPAGRLHVLGRIDDENLSAVLRRAAVLAVPSRAEGFGLPVLEAMAVGTPVVHSDVPSLVEVAGGTGLIVPRGDADTLAHALHEAVSESATTAERVAQGRLRAAQFSWEHAASELWRLHVRFFDLANTR